METHQPSPRETRRSSDNQYMPVAIIVGIILIATIGILTYGSVKKTNELDQVTYEANEVRTLHADLDKHYQEAIAELESFKGSNEEMNALIDQQKQQIEEQRARIEVMIADGKKLAQARREIDNIKAQVAQYVADIEKLQQENVTLTQTKEQLTTERATLQTDISTKEQEQAELTEAKAVLTSENEVLSHSVKVGSVVQVKNARVDALKVRSSGKMTDKKNAKKVDLLKVCFTTMANEVVEPGVEQFYVRIVNPRGETLSVENLGSGSIVNEKTGEEVRFTQAAETEYQNDEQNLCLMWKPDVPFQSGRYSVEIYNKGFLAGKTSFELK
jgi:hypothetical protein